MMAVPAPVKRVMLTNKSALRIEVAKWLKKDRKDQALRRIRQIEHQVKAMSKRVLIGQRYSGKILKSIQVLQQSAAEKFQAARTITDYRSAITDLRTIVAKCELVLTDIEKRKADADKLARHFNDLRMAGRHQGRDAEYQKSREFLKDLRSSQVAIEYIRDNISEALVNIENVMESD